MNVTGGAAEAREERASEGGAPRTGGGRSRRRRGTARYPRRRRRWNHNQEAIGLQDVWIDLSRHGETYCHEVGGTRDISWPPPLLLSLLNGFVVPHESDCCGCCALALSRRFCTEQGTHREHYKSDLHRYNLKLKMKGGAPVSEEEFRLVDANDFFHSDMMGR